MASITFENELNYKNVSQLIKELEAVNNYVGDKDVKKVLYFASVGGKCYAGELLSDYLNNNRDWELVAFGDLHSAAFTVYCKYLGDKRLTRGASACLHIIGFETHSRKEVKPTKNLLRAKKDTYYHNKLLFKFFKKLQLEKQLIKEIKQGKDVYLEFHNLITLNWKNLKAYVENIRD